MYYYGTYTSNLYNDAYFKIVGNPSLIKSNINNNNTNANTTK
jgi:hypothetical protein